MKKIGVITFHKSENYGAFLQCLALQKTLKSLGYSENVINYIPSSEKKKYSLITFLPISGLLKSLLYLLPNTIRKNSFRKAQNLFKYGSANQEYDVAITGSDQVWNNKLTGKKLDTFYTLNSIKAKQKIAYAASTGNANEEFLKKYLYQNIKHINKVSVREIKTKKLLESSGSKKINIVLDPTMLLSKEEWNTILDKQKLAHKTQNPFAVEYMIEKNGKKKTNLFEKENKLAIYDFSRRPKLRKRYHYAYTYGPFEFLDLIRKSKIVFTTSFHGAVFSIIFNKDFYIVIDRKDNRERLENLLSTFGLMDRIIEKDQEINEIKKINWEKVNSKLNMLREDSLTWLKNAIEN